MLKAPVHEKIDLGFQIDAWMDWILREQQLYCFVFSVQISP